MEIALCHPAPDAFRYASVLGCRRGYLEISWSIIQPEPEVFDFSYYDPIVEEAAESGLELIGMVSSQRGIHYFPDGHWIWQNHRGMMPDPAAWSRFLATLVERYREVIRYWEIWSEPNCVACNPMSYYDPELFREVLALGSRIIRGMDPSAKIILGGIWLDNSTCQYVDALLTGGPALEYFDIFTWHFFLMIHHRENIPFRVWKEPLSRLMDFFHSRLPKDCPIWMTEFGLPTKTAASEILRTNTRGGIIGLTDAEQADWFSEFAEVADREWDIGVLVWLMLRDEDDPTDPDHFALNLGMLRADGSEKPIAARIAKFQKEKAAQRTANRGGG